MKLFVTIYEENQEDALRSLRSIDRDHDGIELRVEKFGDLSLAAFREATQKPIILTRRGLSTTEEMFREALEAGIDFVDVEWTGLSPDRRGRLSSMDQSRVVLSHHDYEGMPDIGTTLREMQAPGCAHTKLAVTPRNLAENQRLLEHNAPGVTLIGMGERGLYSRILAPFMGSELAFVSLSEERSAAPGQMTLAHAQQIYGTDRERLRADRVFAVAGNPAGHSLSPAIHNALFRKKKVSAAYTIASFERFEEVADALMSGEISGLSVTTPFKEEALAFAERERGEIGENARAALSVNTLVNRGGRIVADNTDVDGFSIILAQLCGRDRKSVALVGAGATARAALVALQRSGMHTTIFNRSRDKAEALARTFNVGTQPFDALSRFDGEIVIDATSGADVEIPLRSGMSYVRAAYGNPGREQEARDAGLDVFDGVDLLRFQAARQHDLFMKVFEP